MTKEIKIAVSETMMVGEVEVKVDVDNTISGCGPVAHITLSRNGKIILSAREGLVYGKLKPDTRKMVGDLVYRLKLASRGITPEQDAQRIADLDDYDESNAKTVLALNM